LTGSPRHAPTVDLVLLSHGDLTHCGLYAYAHARWGLKAPTYTTLPVQAMGRIATTEDVEGIRDEEDVGDEAENTRDGEDDAVDMLDSEIPETQTSKRKGKYVASLQEVHDAFDSVNTLRYSQPTHLQGTYYIPIPEVCVELTFMINAFIYPDR
jgi:cleavage and polyadenylation specificity factor subunit 2